MPLEVRQLIREISLANPLWGAPRIHGELLKLGIDVGQTSVAKYMARHRRPPSQGWRTFLLNHADGITSIDLFVVPTISFRLLYGLLVLRHDRSCILWLGVTAHPTAEWIARQISEAFGWDPVPRYLIRDHDQVYGEAFTRRIRAMGIRDRPTAPRSPWENGHAERLIGSIRRECLDHVIVFGERHLRHVLRSYARYYNGVRTHLSLGKDSPLPPDVQAVGTISPAAGRPRIAPPLRPNLISDRDRKRGVSRCAWTRQHSRRLVSITDAATAASSGVISPSAICETIADIAAVLKALLRKAAERTVSGLHQAPVMISFNLKTPLTVTPACLTPFLIVGLLSSMLKVLRFLPAPPVRVRYPWANALFF